ncbi:MAG: HAD hydrolase-like protein [Blautia sp.]|nr:HAD hydrolase-like protein [Lachnoclostridium sp.]MCM1211241.1 HAD hydrolase-like protein [Blautia sp.]
MNSTPNPFQYLLFDLDGTLTDPKEGITKCVQYSLHRLGIEEPDLDKLELFIGPPLAFSFRELYGFDENKITDAIKFYRERFGTIGLYENELYPGIKDMLEELKAAGKKLAVASSKASVYVLEILQHFEIKEYFDVIVGSELDGTRTKKEEVIQEALQQLFIEETDDKEEISNKEAVDDSGETSNKATDNKAGRNNYSRVVMIGDRKFDIQGAQMFHLANIGVSFGYAPPGELEEAGADYIVDTVEQLKDFLLGKNGK